MAAWTTTTEQTIGTMSATAEGEAAGEGISAAREADSREGEAAEARGEATEAAASKAAFKTEGRGKGSEVDLPLVKQPLLEHHLPFRAIHDVI